MSNIEDIVRENITVHGVSSHNWNTVFCEVCGDGTHSKGPRGGWLFNGDLAIYHCFNCPAEGNFDHTREQPFSKEMWNILTQFNVPMNEVKDLINKYQIDNNFQTKGSSEITAKIKAVKTIPVPDYFYLLSDAKKTDVIAKKAKDLLKKKCINYKDYPFYLSRRTSKEGIAHETIARTLYNRLIIPFFRNGKMAYYQGRALDDGTFKKYINAGVSRSNIIYGFDKLYKNLDNYLFICEGFFDAFQLDGVSVQENKLSTAQIEILSKSPRKKVIVPDYNGDNYMLAEQAIELGWGLSLPKYPLKFKDTTEAVQGIGKLATLRYITDSVMFGFKAESELIALKF